MDVLNAFSPPDDKEIINTVSGAISFIAAYQRLQHDGNDEYTSDMDKEVLHEEQNIVNHFFAHWDESLIMRADIMLSF